jgi:predicted kinase
VGYFFLCIFASQKNKDMKTNSLGIEITRPTQVLIIMRGIPGSGKSTEAKRIVGNGSIHSTDDVIEAKGDYREFFAKMVEANDFIELSRAHSTNVKNAINSMKSGTSPVIIDNTNIKLNDAKQYVVAALNLGFDDANIQIADVGTGGLNAEQLALRNTHEVPLSTITKMIASHNGQGEMTVESILKSKDKFKPSDVLYSGVVLDVASRTALLDFLNDNIPDNWNIFAHHMTICLGPIKNRELVGKEAVMEVTHLGFSDMAMAVKVDSDVESKNEVKHITIAINPNGGKPVMSNGIVKWQNIKRFKLLGVITEIKAQKQILTQKPK